MRYAAITLSVVAVILLSTSSAMPCSADLTIEKLAAGGGTTTFAFEIRTVAGSLIGDFALADGEAWTDTFTDGALQNQGLSFEIHESDLPAGWALANIQFDPGQGSRYGTPTAIADLGARTITVTIFDLNHATATFVNVGRSVPEPGTIGLVVLGFGALVLVRRRRQ